MKEFAVIGLGRFGSNVARSLSRLGYPVLALDILEDRVQELANEVTHAIQADGNDEEAMRALGLRNLDVVIVAVGSRMESSILITMMLKEMGVRRVIAKASSELHGKVLERVGADQVVFPERDMAIRLANHLVAGNLVDLIELTPEVSIVEFRSPQRLANKALRDLALRAHYGITLLAIRHKDKVIAPPGGDDTIREGDILVAMGPQAELAKLQALDE